MRFYVCLKNKLEKKIIEYNFIFIKLEGKLLLEIKKIFKLKNRKFLLNKIQDKYKRKIIVWKKINY